MDGPSRRAFLASMGGAASGVGLAGCTQIGSGGGGGEPTMAATVKAGPGNSLNFDPERVSVKVGGTVTWTFESVGHNVSAIPEDAKPVEIPDGAEPFASYGADGKPYSDTVPKGGTYEYTFDVPGDYTYVCVPHVGSGMTGHVTVVE